MAKAAVLNDMLHDILFLLLGDYGLELDNGSI